MSEEELPGYSPYGVPPPEASSSTPSLAVPPTTPIPPSAAPSLAGLPHHFLQPRNNLAGPIQTVSLSDMQHDYFTTTRINPTTYSICLTSDDTPLYRVEVDPNLGADPAVQVFDLFSPLPLAAARLHPAVATTVTCTHNPAGDNPKWRQLTQQHDTALPLVVIPGVNTIVRSVHWQRRTKNSTYLELWLRDPLFGNVGGVSTGRELLLARYGIAGVGFSADRVLEIRRGGGLEFELGVVVQIFAILEEDRRKKMRKGK